MRKATGSNRNYSSLIKLLPWFPSLWWKTCVWQNCSHGYCACSEEPAPGQYTLIELILQPFRHFTFVTTHSPALPSLYLRHSSFSNPPVTLPTSQLILQPFRHFTYVTAHSPTLPSLYLRHNSFSNPPVTLPTSQLILQPFSRFTYVITHSPTLPFL